MGKEGRITHVERHGGETAGRFRLLDDALELPGAEAHRLFHDEGDTPVKEVVGGLRHRVVASQCEDEIGVHLVEHIRVVGEGGNTTSDCGDAMRRYVGFVIVDADYLDILHRREMAKVCRVIDGVPVADADRGNSDGHVITSPENSR